MAYFLHATSKQHFRVLIYPHVILRAFTDLQRGTTKLEYTTTKEYEWKTSEKTAY